MGLLGHRSGGGGGQMGGLGESGISWGMDFMILMAMIGLGNDIRLIHNFFYDDMI
jgi:hypothetical protein